jgi:hypothetical protein
MDVRRKTPHAATREKGCGDLVGEALDHERRIVRVTFYVKEFATLLAPMPSAFPEAAGSETLFGVRLISACGSSCRDSFRNRLGIIPRHALAIDGRLRPLVTPKSGIRLATHRGRSPRYA